MLKDYQFQIQNFYQKFNWEYNGESYTINFEIHEELFDYYNGLNNGKQDYSIYTSSSRDKELIGDISEKLENFAMNKGDKKLAPYLAASFVQSLRYTSDKVTTGFNDYARYPYETLYEEGGDCEDTSILTAKFLKEMGYGAVLLYFDMPSNEDHVAVGVRCAEGVTGVCYLYEGKDYFYLETTGENWDVGEIPDDYKGISARVIEI